MALLGQLTFQNRGRGRAQLEDLYGLPVLRARTDPEGWLGEGRLKRAGQTLERGGVLRTLVPAGFGRWDLLRPFGLIPVEAEGFLKAQSSFLALGALERQGLAPDRATVALRGMRVDRDMARAAVRLCPQVRHLVISAPRGGRELALWLRREFGIPILPEEKETQLALCFHPESGAVEGAALKLWGPEPDLGGMTLTAPALAQEDREDLAVLSALWEGGKLMEKDLKIT